MNPIDFNHLVLPKTPNYALATPAGSPYPADFVVPNYKMTQAELADQILRVLKKMPRMTLVKEDAKNFEYTFVQKTLIFRFPDWIDIKVLAIDEHSSTFIMLSRSQYGHSDFGVNKKRVKSILEALSTVQ